MSFVKESSVAKLHIRKIWMQILIQNLNRFYQHLLSCHKEIRLTGSWVPELSPGQQNGQLTSTFPSAIEIIHLFLLIIRYFLIIIDLFVLHLQLKLFAYLPNYLNTWITFQTSAWQFRHFSMMMNLFLSLLKAGFY